MKTVLLLFVFTVLLCGCSNSPPRWNKFGFTHQQFLSDWEACQKEESVTECMTAKGYTEDRS